MNKVIILLVFVSINMAYGQASCLIKGVVLCQTEHENIFPDRGASIYVIQAHYLPEDFQILCVDSLVWITKKIRSYQEVQHLNDDQEPKKSIGEELDEFGIKSRSFEDSVYKALDHRAVQRCNMIIKNDHKICSVADTDGSYSIKVKPGSYYVLMKSNHVRALNFTEYNGNVYFSYLTIRSGEERFVDARFYPVD